jgi:thiamine-phosphate pyrophosphorylase
MDVLDTWLHVGVRLVQLRAKRLALGPMLEMTDRMIEKTRAAGAHFVINDRADVARLSIADGVHLGQADLGVQEARGLLRDHQFVGISTHDAAQVRRALDDRPDYLAIGPVRETKSKERPDPAVGLEGTQAAAALAHGAGVPIVAIGGITLESAPAVIAAGADAVAVISDLVAGDWRTRAAEFLRALD